MEFLAGYAAAKAPYSAYTVEPHHPQSQRSNRPARSNSTSGSTTKKRSRIRGHARTNSASTSSSSGRTENHQAPAHNPAWIQQQQQQPQQQQQHSAGGLDASGPGVEASFVSPSASAPALTTNLIPNATPRATAFTDQYHHGPRRERAVASTYYQDKQLPATPRLNTHEAASNHLFGSTAFESTSARTPASASATTPISFPDRRLPHHAAMFTDGGSNPKASAGTVSLPRTESVTSVGGQTTASGRTALSSQPPSASEAAANQLRPFVVRNGRTYIADSSLPYPLPVDLEELHRQNLKTMLLLELYGRPICAPHLANKPPARILETGCGTGFWSMMCYRYYEAKGQHKNISFTGLDIVPLAPATGGPSAEGSKSTTSSSLGTDMRPDKDMNWRFVQHDLRKLPLPFPDGSFDLVLVKDLGLATSMEMQQGLVDEYIRVLSPGGTVEIWESDHTLRMLRPHVPETPSPAEGGGDDEDGGNNDDDELHQKSLMSLGAYNITANTPLSAPLNNYLVEYNGWISRALEARDLFCMPCTVLGPLLIQEAEILKGVGSRRLAIPLSEVRWEKEGVGGVVTKDGKSYIESKARKVGKDGMPVGGQALEPAAAAVRRTALTIVVQQIQSLEHILREVSGKSQDEWDAWVGKMTNDLVKENGTSWGECLEIGAWWARKI